MRMNVDLLDHDIVLAHFSQAVTPAKAAAKWVSRLRDVFVCRRMRDSQWAVHSVAVTHFNLVVRRRQPLVVAPLAEVVRPEAMEERH